MRQVVFSCWVASLQLIVHTHAERHTTSVQHQGHMLSLSTSTAHVLKCRDSRSNHLSYCLNLHKSCRNHKLLSRQLPTHVPKPNRSACQAGARVAKLQCTGRVRICQGRQICLQLQDSAPCPGQTSRNQHPAPETASSRTLGSAGARPAPCRRSGACLQSRPALGGQGMSQGVARCRCPRCWAPGLQHMQQWEAVVLPEGAPNSIANAKTASLMCQGFCAVCPGSSLQDCRIADIFARTY